MYNTEESVIGGATTLMYWFYNRASSSEFNRLFGDSLGEHFSHKYFEDCGRDGLKFWSQLSNGYRAVIAEEAIKAYGVTYFPQPASNPLTDAEQTEEAFNRR